jgi:amidase
MTWAAVRVGEALSALEHAQAEIAVARVSALMDGLLEEYDLILSPALAHGLPGIGEWDTAAQPCDAAALHAHFERFTAIAPFSALANVAGCPAIVVPHGCDQRGMPLAVQMMAARTREPLLISVAAHLESVAPWPVVAPLAYV